MTADRSQPLEVWKFGGASLADGQAIRLVYIKSDTLTVTAAEYAAIRQVFDSIRVTGR